MTREEGKCLGRVFDGWRSYPCRNKATTPKGYCKLHDPDIKGAKAKARSKAWDEKWEAQRKHIAEAKAKQEELERKAALYDALEKEREGEEVLWEGEAKTAYRESVKPLEVRFGINLDGVHGQLIFRPTKAEKGGE